MGAYDDAEVSKLGGTFLLTKLNEICSKNKFRLNRNSSLCIFRKKSATQLNKVKKGLQRLLKQYDL